MYNLTVGDDNDDLILGSRITQWLNIRRFGQKPSKRRHI